MKRLSLKETQVAVIINSLLSVQYFPVFLSGSQGYLSDEEWNEQSFFRSHIEKFMREVGFEGEDIREFCLFKDAPGMFKSHIEYLYGICSGLANDEKQWITAHPHGKNSKGVRILIDTSTNTIIGGLFNNYIGLTMKELCGVSYDPVTGLPDNISSIELHNSILRSVQRVNVPDSISSFEEVNKLKELIIPYTSIEYLYAPLHIQRDVLKGATAIIRNFPVVAFKMRLIGTQLGLRQSILGSVHAGEKEVLEATQKDIMDLYMDESIIELLSEVSSKLYDKFYQGTTPQSTLYDFLENFKFTNGCFSRERLDQARSVKIREGNTNTKEPQKNMSVFCTALSVEALLSSERNRIRLLKYAPLISEDPEDKFSLGVHGQQIAHCYSSGHTYWFDNCGIMLNDKYRFMPNYKALVKKFRNSADAAKHSLADEFTPLASVIVHEAAHALDSMLDDLSNSKEIDGLLNMERALHNVRIDRKKLDPDKNMDYALTSAAEYFAERITEAITSSNPSVFATRVFDIARNRYISKMLQHRIKQGKRD